MKIEFPKYVDVLDNLFELALQIYNLLIRVSMRQ